MHKEKEELHALRRDHAHYDHAMPDGEMFLQALNGFLMILTCEGEVFFATHSIESYLGFHQSDIVHQSVYELVHSEDREELQRQLLWNSFLPPEASSLTLQDALRPERAHLLERSFTVRFRCLLDNTSGFLRLDIRGRVKVLHGQNKKTEEPPLALFAICAPFGPPSLLEIPQKEVMFKSKHKLDLSLVSMDQRGKMLLGYTDAELANMGGYDLVHYDDLAYVASAHQECKEFTWLFTSLSHFSKVYTYPLIHKKILKTGASGMIAYRFQSKEGPWQWLQTSSRLVYKNSKPDFVISTHRPLMEEEGRDLLGKRTMDFKVSYLDTGLTSLYFSESEQLSGCETAPTTPPRTARRYKTQLRDFLSTCRNKRRVPTTPAPPPVDYLAADAVAAAYTNLNGAYPTPYGEYPPAPALHYAPPPLDDRFLSADNIFHQYKPLSYHYTPYAPNGFLEPAPPPPGYEVAPSVPYRPPSRDYTYMDSSGRYMSPVGGVDRRSPSVVAGPSPGGSSGSADHERMQQQPSSEMPRQTVLMWGAGGAAQEVPVEYSPPQVWRYHPSHAYHTAEATQ
ncbi:aryl hydrocarbon receptor [Plutella xylostella]|uniref:aryl hydrocarbon receptor n=1 Tax=Plutella xylostella TaxID=51655 RepID=UPI002032A678|nr:aryl hydrocarbon receptor [Plutella xylostella]